MLKLLPAKPGRAWSSRSKTLRESLLILLAHGGDNTIVDIVLEKLPGHHVETHEYQDDKEYGLEHGAHPSLSADEPALRVHATKPNW